MLPGYQSQISSKLSLRELHHMVDGNCRRHMAPSCCISSPKVISLVPPRGGLAHPGWCRIFQSHSLSVFSFAIALFIPKLKNEQYIQGVLGAFVLSAWEDWFWALCVGYALLCDKLFSFLWIVVFFAFSRFYFFCMF